jgi:hypothetical protein
LITLVPDANKSKNVGMQDDSFIWTRARIIKWD